MVEARDGIEPPNEASFWVPRPLPHIGIVTAMNQALHESPAAVLLVPLHKVPPPKESMKKLLENHGLRRSIRDKRTFASRT
jgi:hypothetical protein